MNQEKNSAHSFTEGSDAHIETGSNNVRDWVEDFPHENGRYVNICRECGGTFIGHKRRMICKVCMEPNWEELSKKTGPKNMGGVYAGCWNEGEMVGFARCMVKKVIPIQSELQRLKEEIEEAKFWANEQATGLNTYANELSKANNTILVLTAENERLKEERDKEMIEFAEWLLENAETNGGVWFYVESNNYGNCTSETMVEQFKASKK